MSSAICSNLDQSKILPSGNELNLTHSLLQSKVKQSWNREFWKILWGEKGENIG